MAQTITVMLQDDVDGTEAAESIKFALDGVTYEIDLSAKNATKLRKSLDSFVQAARRVGGRRVTAKRPATAHAPSSVDTRAVRAWAESNGYQVSDRGRISTEVMDAFHAAGN